MEIKFTPKGVCSRQMNIVVEDGVVQNVQIIGGCHGNTQGVAALCKGMKVEEVVQKLDGIRCGMKPTSCPDQLAKALRECM